MQTEEKRKSAHTFQQLKTTEPINIKSDIKHEAFQPKRNMGLDFYEQL